MPDEDIVFTDYTDDIHLGGKEEGQDALEFTTVQLNELESTVV